MTLPGILVACGHWDPEPWAAPFRAAGRPVAIWPDVGDPAAIRYVLAWGASSAVFADLPNLAAIFSLGAGVDHIVGKAELPDLPIVRVVDPDLTMRMTEWVVLQVLLHHRRQLAYLGQQQDRVWRELPQPPASAVRVGIMGLGELGQASAKVLASLGFEVAGWSRTPKTLPGISTFAGADTLPAFLARTDILVVLLPLTDATRGIIDAKLLAGLARDGALGGPVLINGGRGGLQVEADILAAIDAGTLIGASLDVFEQEPLPATSPLWSRRNIVITPHVAATSDADVLAAGIQRAIEDFEAGKPLENLVDVERGY
ncbi:glyoxylate/hydroxypyruvate reductase A [Kaistia geumhonensis]|uniref:Glyoxylate/hydroxypyruvate reductase A n=1 Tax=Kaistia geumhonensis TaxID=410839 RepID=A0ABU0MA91_9HYPH|nr:glyoxylate/hydroxypyruvate reductase A [Kaistia geumhonensis]MCX5480428.1 glyoxylate/hydroxypyruvate reductase A [Kaistia geumhonensis]MDQ0517872.1 glyoxylate/hydroxypyruvate reductase A [Kaistia geumhonensis]